MTRSIDHHGAYPHAFKIKFTIFDGICDRISLCLGPWRQSHSNPHHQQWPCHCTVGFNCTAGQPAQVPPTPSLPSSLPPPLLHLLLRPGLDIVGQLNVRKTGSVLPDTRQHRPRIQLQRPLKYMIQLLSMSLVNHQWKTPRKVSLVKHLIQP